MVKGSYIIKSDLRYYADIEAFGVKMKFPLFERDALAWKRPVGADKTSSCPVLRFQTTG
jgi:hypothetical protein